MFNRLKNTVLVDMEKRRSLLRGIQDKLKERIDDLEISDSLREILLKMPPMTREKEINRARSARTGNRKNILILLEDAISDSNYATLTEDKLRGICVEAIKSDVENETAVKDLAKGIAELYGYKDHLAEYAGKCSSQSSRSPRN